MTNLNYLKIKDAFDPLKDRCWTKHNNDKLLCYWITFYLLRYLMYKRLF